MNRASVVTNGTMTPNQYIDAHRWVERRLGRPSQCENCGSVSALKYEWANLSGEYRKDISDWARLCTSCHRRIDNDSRYCRKGHEFTPETTYQRPDGRKDCRVCSSERSHHKPVIRPVEAIKEWQ